MSVTAKQINYARALLRKRGLNDIWIDSPLRTALHLPQSAAREHSRVEAWMRSISTAEGSELIQFLKAPRPERERAAGPWR